MICYSNLRNTSFYVIYNNIIWLFIWYCLLLSHDFKTVSDILIKFDRI